MNRLAATILLAVALGIVSDAAASSFQTQLRNTLSTQTTEQITRCPLGAQNFPGSSAMKNPQIKDPCGTKGWIRCLQDKYK